MKSLLKKIIAIICAFIFLAAPLQTFAAGNEDGKFVELSVVGYDKEGNQKTESAVFYVKDNVLYAPVEFFEKYTLYRYDNENNAFIRSSQEYMKSTSKVIFDYEKNKARVLYSATYAKDYDMITYLHGNTRFFPLAQTAGYLKSSIVYQDKDKISVVNSGISMWDALYDYIPEGESLSYAKICDDLYAGNDLIYTVSGALGYFGETVFDFRLSNLVVIGPYADIKKYEDILSSAVTNNDIYKAAFDKNTLQSELLDLTFKRIVGDLYGSTEKTYSLTSQAISTIYDDHKDSIFTDDNLYDTPFQNMKSDVAELKEIGEIVDVVGKVIDVAEYIYEFAQMNSDNRDALAYANMICQTKDSEAKAIGNVAVKYVGAVDTDFLKDQLVESVKEELKDFDNAKSVLEYANKIKLATSIVNAAFKLGGFDLADNSSYDVLMASDLYYYLINKSPVIDQGYAKTLKESEEMRLANIMLMLVNIEAYKMGNAVAKKIDKTDSNHYGRQIAEMEQRLAMLYRSKNSEKYDCIEGIKTVIKENQEEIAKFDFAAMNSTEYQSPTVMHQDNYSLKSGLYYVGKDIQEGSYILDAEKANRVRIFRNENEYKAYKDNENPFYEDKVEFVEWEKEPWAGCGISEREEQFYVRLEEGNLIVVDGECELSVYKINSLNMFYSGWYEVGKDFDEGKINIYCDNEFIEIAIFADEESFKNFLPEFIRAQTYDDTKNAFQKYALTMISLDHGESADINLKNGMVLFGNSAASIKFSVLED